MLEFVHGNGRRKSAGSVVQLFGSEFTQIVLMIASDDGIGVRKFQVSERNNGFKTDLFCTVDGELMQINPLDADGFNKINQKVSELIYSIQIEQSNKEFKYILSA